MVRVVTSKGEYQIRPYEKRRVDSGESRNDDTLVVPYGFCARMAKVVK